MGGSSWQWFSTLAARDISGGGVRPRHQELPQLRSKVPPSLRASAKLRGLSVGVAVHVPFRQIFSLFLLPKQQVHGAVDWNPEPAPVRNI